MSSAGELIYRTNALGCSVCGSTIGGGKSTDWCCYECGEPMPERRGYNKTGTGDWESFEMFQLHPNDPLRKEVNSMSDYKQACQSRHLDPDTHRPTASNPKFGFNDNGSW